MGAKGSFAIASLTHHVFIHYAFSQLIEKGKQLGPIEDLYAIVGDDLVIFNKDLADQVQNNYLKVGVEIQHTKSKVPVGNNYFTEFCSRTSINNIDVSRVPPNLIRNASENFRDIPSLLIQMKKRGIRPKVSLLYHVPYLCKVRQSGKSYLNHLSQLLLLPLMGEDLTEFATELDPMVKLPLRIDQAICFSSVIHMLRTTEKLDEAIDIFMNSLQLTEGDYEKLMDIDWNLDSNPKLKSPADHC